MFKCNKCGAEIDDQRLVACPKCGTIRSDNTIFLNADQEKYILHKLWHRVIKYLFGSFSIICVISVITIVYSAFKAYNAGTRHFEKLLIDQISKEFEEPRIRETVSNVAEATSKHLMAEEIGPEVKKFKIEIDNTLKESVRLSQNAQLQFDQLKNIIELEDAARFGSRYAYISLKKIALTQGPFAIMAQRRISSIERELLSYYSVPGIRFGLIINRNDKKIEADKLSTEELFNCLQSSKLAKDHVSSLMGHIADKPKNEICQGAKNILEHSDSLIGCAATCGILRKVLGEKAPFLDFDQWVEVCNAELSKLVQR